MKYLVPGEHYLYLSADHIVHLPTFEKIRCEQNFPEHLYYDTAGLVTQPWGDTERLMLCGGGCFVRTGKSTEDGWHKVDDSFDRYGLYI